MSKWANRATEHFSHASPERAPITPETHLLGVLGVAYRCVPANEAEILGVLGVHPPGLPESHHVKEAELVAGAMKACNHFNDSAVAREEMRRQVLEVPRDQWQGLIVHFNTTYAAGGTNHG